MSTIRVPPGRAGRLWLRARLDVAERGVSLLEQKVRILGDERRRLRALTEDTGRDWERAYLEARTWTLRATLLGGQRSIQHATPDNPATVTVTSTTTMGIRYPDGADCSPPRPDGPVVVDSSAIVYSQTCESRGSRRRCAPRRRTRGRARHRPRVPRHAAAGHGPAPALGAQLARSPGEDRT